MKKTLFLILLIILTAQTLHSQSWQWARRIGGSFGPSQDNPNELVSDMQTDAQGNVYICGRVCLGANFNGTPMTTYSSYGYTIFLAKLDCNGNLLWQRTAGGSMAGNEAYSLALDGLGHIYLTGKINGSFMNPVYFLDSLIADSSTIDMFLAKFDTAGNFKWVTWAAKGSAALLSYGLKVRMDNAGMVNVMGLSAVAGVLFPGFNVIRGGFFARFDTSGIMNRYIFLGPELLYKTINDYVIHPVTGDQYITGKFSTDSLVIGNGDTVLYKLSSGTRSDLFLATFDSSGNFRWAFNYGTNKFMEGFGVAATATGVALTGQVGNNYTIGTVTLTNPFSPAGNSYFPFIATYDFNGTLIGVVPIYTQAAASKPSAGITRLANQSLAVGGWFAGMAIVGQDTLSGQGLTEVFLAIANANLLFTNSDKIQGTGNSEEPLCITSDSSGNVYIGGGFDGTMTVNGVNYTNAGGNTDGFIAKYGYNCTTGIEEETAAAQQQNRLHVYPNPATDIIYLSSINGEIEKATLYNVLGEKVISQKPNRSSSGISINVSSLPAGLYFVTVDKNGDRLSARVVVQRE